MENNPVLLDICFFLRGKVGLFNRRVCSRGNNEVEIVERKCRSHHLVACSRTCCLALLTLPPPSAEMTGLTSSSRCSPPRPSRLKRWYLTLLLLDWFISGSQDFTRCSKTHLEVCTISLFRTIVCQVVHFTASFSCILLHLLMGYSLLGWRAGCSGLG